jgi:hypothetical protein
MALARIPLFGRTLTVRRYPYFRKEEVRGQVPSVRVGKLRISWWPKEFNGRLREYPER